jgi:hypothetical protein
MEKPDLEIFGTPAGAPVNKLHPGLLNHRQRLTNIRDGKRDMVDSFAPFFQEFPDRAIGGRRFEKLDLRLSDPEKRGLHLLVCHFLDGIAGSPQKFFEERDGVRKTPDRNANMLDVCWLHTLTLR